MLRQVADDLLHLVLQRYPIVVLVQIVVEEMALDLVHLVDRLLSFLSFLGFLWHGAAKLTC